MAVIVMVIVIVEKILPILPISSGDSFSFFFFIANIGISFYISLLLVLFLKKTCGEKNFQHKQQTHKTLSTTPKNKRLQIPLELAVVCQIICMLILVVIRMITRWFFQLHPSLFHYIRMYHVPW